MQRLSLSTNESLLNLMLEHKEFDKVVTLLEEAGELGLLGPVSLKPMEEWDWTLNSETYLVEIMGRTQLW